MNQHWKVGELAARTGLTVRTLHHYDEIGLLSPGLRAASGHRLYTAADVRRLQQVVSLKQLGFSLEEIAGQLSRTDFDPRRVVKLHLERIRGQADELKRLTVRLEALSAALGSAEEVSAEVFLTTIQEMTMIEKYYTPEQLEQIEARKHAIGPARMEEAQAEWPKLFAAVESEMAAGIDPTDPKVQALAHKWFGLVAEFTGGDPGLFKSVKRMYENEDQIKDMDVKAKRPMFAYIERARLAAGIELPK